MMIGIMSKRNEEIMDKIFKEGIKAEEKLVYGSVFSMAFNR